MRSMMGRLRGSGHAWWCCWLWFAITVLGASCTDDGAGSSSLRDAGSSDGARGDASPAQISVVSADGLATLRFSEGALPAGVERDQVKVTVLDSGALSGDLKGWVWSAGYRLEPDGTTLLSEAKLQLTLTPPNTGPLLLLHQRRGDAESAVLSQRLRDESTGELTGYEIELTHFSTLIALSNPDDPSIATRVVIPARDRIVGESFIVGAEITPQLRGEKEMPAFAPNLDEFPARRLTWDTSLWSYDGIADAYDAAIQPAYLRLAPDSVRGPRTTATARFSCVAEGPYDITLRPTAYIPAMLAFIREGQPVTRESGPLKMFGYVSREELAASCVAPTSDATGDCVDSVSSRDCTYRSGQIDITGHDGRSESITDQEAAALYGSEGRYACERDDSARGGDKVVCPAGSEVMPAGTVHTYTMLLKQAVPLADEGRSFIYSLVFDSDGNSANNWRFVEPFDWDYFQGADLWIQLIWDHRTQVWTVTVTRVDEQQHTSVLSTSTVRVIINGRAITFKVSGGEFSLAKPLFRFAAFGHDGNASENDRGGDVSGSDPSQALRPTQ